MVDPVSLSIALGGVLVGVLALIKHSKCWSCEVATRTPSITRNPSPIPPVINLQDEKDKNILSV